MNVSLTRLGNIVAWALGPAGIILSPAIAVAMQWLGERLGSERSVKVTEVVAGVFEHLGGDAARSFLSSLKAQSNHDLEIAVAVAIRSSLQTAGKQIARRDLLLEERFENWFSDWDKYLHRVIESPQELECLFYPDRVVQHIAFGSADDQESWVNFSSLLARWASEERSMPVEVLPTRLDAYLSQNLPRLSRQSLQVVLRDNRYHRAWIAWVDSFLLSTAQAARASDNQLAANLEDLANSSEELHSRMSKEFSDLHLQLDQISDLIKMMTTTILENIVTQTKPSQSSMFIWSVPHHRNPNFTGRDVALDEIHSSLVQPRGTVATVVLTGLGGMGKTQIVIEYAYRYASDYNLVWWIHSEERTSLRSDYAKLASRLNPALASGMEEHDLIKLAQEWLVKNSGWLLIFDNAVDAAALAGFLPNSPTGHAIVTSRNPAWGDLGHPRPVSAFDRAESIQFLVGRTSDSDSQAANDLASAMGDLPLALGQAAAYIERTSTSLAKYLSLFRKKRTELWEHELPPLQYPETVATTWALNMEHLSENSSPAAALLNLLSFLGPDFIPVEELLRSSSGSLPDALSSIAKSEIQLREALGALRSYSMLSSFDSSVSVHRLVQAVTRERLAESERKSWAKTALGLLRRAFPRESDEYESWETCARLLPHALAVSRHAIKMKVGRDASSWLLNQAGLYLRAKGEIDQAEAALDEALALGDTEYER